MEPPVSGGDFPPSRQSLRRTKLAASTRSRGGGRRPGRSAAGSRRQFLANTLRLKLPWLNSRPACRAKPSRGVGRTRNHNHSRL